MKKRLISMLLAVLMVVSLFSGMSVSAYADNATYNTIKYTMVAGDYVLRICQRLGLNFYVCKDVIMRLNNITDAQWRYLPVGKEILLPASDGDAVAFLTGKPAASSTPTTTTTVTTTPTTVAAPSTKTNNDVLAYYLVPHTMGSGETVIGVCASLGTLYSNRNAKIIKAVNGLSDWTTLRAGSTYLFPVVNDPAPGTACKAVYLHKVVSGDTAYSICNAGGISYSNNVKTIQAVNPDLNLSKIKAGNDFYYPVDIIFSAVPTVTDNSSNSSGGNAASGSGAVPSSGSSLPNTKSYKLTANMDSGSILFYVNGKAVTTAAAGEKVSVVATTDKGKTVKSMTVKHLDGKADLLLTGDTFIMPQCDVRVDVVVTSGHSVTLEENYVGKSVAQVDGIGVTGASKDTKVMIVSTDPTYQVEKVYAYYKTLSGAKKILTITSNGFVMPDFDVVVEVTLKPVTTYAFIVNNPANGSFFLQVNGGQVSRAAKGAQVSIVAKGLDGYEPTGVTVKTSPGGESVNVFSNTFTMPGSDVEIEVTFGQSGNNILIMPSEGGTAVAKVGGKEVTEAKTDEKVYLSATANDGYTLDHYEVIRNKDGYSVKTDKDDAFKMPSGGVVVTPVFKGKDVTILGLIALDPANNPPKVTDAVDKYVGASVVLKYRDEVHEIMTHETSGFTARIGDDVDVNVVVDTAYDSLAFEYFYVFVNGTYDHDLTETLRLNRSFKIPAKTSGGADVTSVNIRTVFSAGKVSLDSAVISGVGTASYAVKDGTEFKSVGSAKVGEKVYVICSPGTGYKFDDASYLKKLVVTRKDNGSKVEVKKDTDGYYFEMPVCGVDVQVIFDPTPFVITLKAKDEFGKDLTGLGLWYVQINKNEPIVDNKTTMVDVKFDDLVWVGMTDAGKSGYDMISLTLDGAEYISKVKNYSYSFYMNGSLAKSFEVVATLRSKTPAPKKFALKPSYKTSMGNVECVIAGSTFNPGSVNDVVAVKEALATDTVGILAKPMTGYAIDEDHITVKNGRGAVMELTETTNTDGQKMWTFEMPEDGCSISVDFFAEAFTATFITLEDVWGDPHIADGFVKFLCDGVTVRDVVSTTDPIDGLKAHSMVQLLVTEAAKAQGWRIEVDSATVTGSSSGSKVEFAAVTDGIQFKMPAESVEIELYLYLDASVAPIKLNGSMSHGALKFTNGGNVITEARPGTEVTIEVIPDTGYRLKGDSLRILKKSDNTIISEELGGGKWKFTMPEGGIKIQAEFEPEEYEITFSITTGKTVQISVDGGSTKGVVNGDKLIAKFGSTVSISAANSGEKIDSVTLSSGVGTVSGKSFKVGAGVATLTIAVS